MSMTIIEQLEKHGDGEAVVFHGRTCTYRQLVDMVADWRVFLDEHHIDPGRVVALEGAYSPQLCAGLLALIERRVVAVPLSALPAAKRAEFFEVAEVEIAVTADETGPGDVVRTGTKAAHPLYRELRDADRPGLVLFSSGTTGRSKASVLDFQKALDRYTAGGRANRILSFLSLDHIGGINTLLHTLVQGGTVVTVADRSPETVFAAVERHRVEVLPTTPTFLNMVLISGVLERFDCSSLRLVTYGTEPMPIRTLTRLARDLPGARLKQTYGLSELGILPTKSRGDDTLWVKLGDAGFEHKIIDDILWIRSDMAMLGYLNAEAPFDADGFFNTQDVVETDGEWLRILGRRSEIINVGGEKVYPSEVESAVLEVPGIAEATVSGHPSHVTGMVVKATVLLGPDVAEDHRSVQRRVRAHCSRRLEAFKVPAVVEVSTARQHSDRFKKIRSAS
ncbi:class I adenylate-forming enzyme family protein [Glycomyces arizonensis]|uniref:class I adenylate-forming enzyme family protein n=1 Tax=Glycomyces arizonensis TaxID=256035 RepID=UPI0004102C61|nr:fatty acid--CoA ligase family protein [Glycomyces arizonensis]